MNEFIKEELEYIYNHICKGASCIRYDSLKNLENKIQSMIDNYDKNKQISEYRKLIGDIGYE